MYKILPLLLLFLFSPSSQAQQDAPCAHHSAVLFQVSTIDALLAGAYDGQTSIADLARHGDFGIGTFAALDGEMLAVDGVFYQVKADGVAYRAAPEAMTPFADVLPLESCASLDLPPGLTLAELDDWLDGKLGNLNLFYAIRIDGSFERMKTRAVPAQNKPYRPLAEVVKTQPVFDLGSVEGVLVGLRSPAFSRGISVTGYHWHFLTADKKAGGHVLDFKLARGSAKVDPVDGFDVRLPRGAGFGALDLARDRTRELDAVEK